jgi:hypothetical protein
MEQITILGHRTNEYDMENKNKKSAEQITTTKKKQKINICGTNHGYRENKSLGHGTKQYDMGNKKISLRKK